MVTMTPSSGPSGAPVFGAPVRGLGFPHCGIAINRQTGAFALALRVVDAGQSGIEILTTGSAFHEVPELSMVGDVGGAVRRAMTLF